MEIRVRATGAVMFEDELRRFLRENGGPSYDALTPEVMEEIGVDPILESPQPVNGTVYQYSIRQGVEQGADGQWYAKYVLGPSFSNTQEQAEYEAAKDAEQADIVRRERNEKLAACDWTQLSDSPIVGFAWANYRQALRDVPAQEGFPWNVNWPVKP
jgi:hypothetical protein